LESFEKSKEKLVPRTDLLRSRTETCKHSHRKT